MKIKPVVSIVIPIHNSARHLKDCLDSIFSQSFKQFEIIVIDDNSKDKTSAILKTYKKRQKRLHVYRNIKKYGLVVSLNRAAKRAKGQFICFVNPKDALTKSRIKKQVDFLTANPKAVAVGTQCIFFDKHNKKKGKSLFPPDHETIYPDLLAGLSMNFETAMINKNLLPKDIIKFDDEHYPFIHRDLFMKLTPYGQLANINQYLNFHRVSNNKYATWEKRLDNLISLFKLWIKAIKLEKNTNELGVIDSVGAVMRILRLSSKITLAR